MEVFREMAPPEMRHETGLDWRVIEQLTRQSKFLRVEMVCLFAGARNTGKYTNRF
jgi:hypothetical protein